MLNNASFPAGLSWQERLRYLSERRSDFAIFLQQKRPGDADCEEAEAAARALRKRAVGQPPRRKDDKLHRSMQLALMDLTYAERQLVGRKLRQATAEVQACMESSPGGQIKAHAVVSKAEITVITSASSREKPEVIFEQSLRFARQIERYAPLSNKLIVVNINLPEGSPKYYFFYLEREIDTRKVQCNSDMEMCLPRWINFTPEARF